MRRRVHPARRDWRQRVDDLGLDFHTIDGAAYWVDDGCYHFDEAQIDRLEAAGNTLHALCLEAVDHVVRTGEYAALGLTDACAALVEASWRAGEPALYGRMDLAWTGEGEPRLLEYNADTPTALYEASVVQWQWFEDTCAGRDQFNLIHEKLIERWRAIIDPRQVVHLAGCLQEDEDRLTVEYLADTCLQAGGVARVLAMDDIGWDGQAFVDADEHPIARLFKLYPWEWLLAEPFAAHVPQARTRWIEPAWKQVLSNKALLPLLWRLFPGHPNLLPASFDPHALSGAVVVKPCFGREGEGVRLWGEPPLAVPDGHVVQAYAPLYQGAHGHAVLGLWIVGDEAVGLGVREDDGPVTGNRARFVPHCFD